MKRLISLVSASILGMPIIFSQSTFTTNISSNNIEAEINSNGQTISSFRNTSLSGSDAMQSTLRSSGLWITGLDPAGNLSGSIQMINENGNSDFQTNPEFNNIWKVNRVQVLSHQDDWNDNNQIDNPVSAVFEWPISTSLANLAGEYFNIDNTYSTYDPESGDYPIVGIPNCVSPIIPNEFVLASFNDYVLHTETNLAVLGVDISQTAFSFNCTDSEVINNTVFIKYHITNTSFDPIPYLRIGIFNDFAIGCDEDDYIGSIPDRGIQYAYNANESDCDDGFEINPPVHAMQLVLGPKFYDQTLDAVIEARTEFLLPIGHTESGIDTPQNGLDYWNFMNGKLANGTPIDNLGLLYTGDPTDPNAWSERSENNMPGERKTVSVLETFPLQPGQVTEFIIAHTVYGGGSMTSNEALQLMQTNTEVETLFDDCLQTGCIQSVTTKTREISASEIQVYPNPVNNRVFVDYNKPIDRLSIYNLLGQKVISDHQVNSVEVSGLLPGSYLLEVISEGARHIEKIVVVD